MSPVDELLWPTTGEERPASRTGRERSTSPTATTSPPRNRDTSTCQAPPQHPEAAHVHDEDGRQTDEYSTDSDREATELRPMATHVYSPDSPPRHWHDFLRRFWRHQVRVTVPHVDCRDHLANERTFLGWMRTSVMLSINGVFIAQLYRLQQTPPAPGETALDYYALSTPLSCTFYAAALCTVVLGSVRFWRQQSAMTTGRVHAGGAELTILGGGVLLLLVLMFGLHVALDAVKESEA